MSSGYRKCQKETKEGEKEPQRPYPALRLFSVFLSLHFFVLHTRSFTYIDWETTRPIPSPLLAPIKLVLVILQCFIVYCCSCVCVWFRDRESLTTCPSESPYFQPLTTHRVSIDGPSMRRFSFFLFVSSSSSTFLPLRATATISVSVSPPPPTQLLQFRHSLRDSDPDSPASAQPSTCPGLDISLFVLHFLLLSFSFFCFSSAYSYLLRTCRISFLTSMLLLFLPLHSRPLGRVVSARARARRRLPLNSFDFAS